MLSKLSVLKVTRFPPAPLRHYGSANLLKHYEKLRALCCTSESALAKEEAEKKITPRTSKCCNKPCDDNDTFREPYQYLDLEKKTGMVVGGASGIGFEAADNLLKEGMCRVIIADIDQDKACGAVSKLNQAYGEGKAVFSLTDIMQMGSIESTFKCAYQNSQQVEVYINCVGIYNENPKSWESMVHTNLNGCIRGTLTAYKYMSGNNMECNGAVIVNLASYGSIANVPSMPLFSAVSNAITGLTSSFGQEFHFSRSKVRFVTVCPAGTDSDLLKSMSRHHYEKSWASHSMSAMKYCTKQSPKVVGKAIVNAARFGHNGCVYVVKEGKYFRFATPDYTKIMRKEACFW